MQVWIEHLFGQIEVFCFQNVHSDSKSTLKYLKNSVFLFRKKIFSFYFLKTKIITVSWEVRFLSSLFFDCKISALQQHPSIIPFIIDFFGVYFIIFYNKCRSIFKDLLIWIAHTKSMKLWETQKSKEGESFFYSYNLNTT